MKIDGNALAKKIQKDIVKDVKDLEDHGVTPHIAIVTVGDEDSWKVYVTRKAQLATSLGIRTTIVDLSQADEEALVAQVSALNLGKSVHGIIIQRPLPKNLDESRVVTLIDREKDIDAFRTDSTYPSPVAEGVSTIIEKVYNQNIKDALKNKRVVVLGKGSTAGAPTAKALKEYGAGPVVIDSKTPNASELQKDADIVISAVGKRVVHAKDIKRGALVIGIGTHVVNGNLEGDYNEEEISKVAKAYTPTPGGIGPLNVSFLFKNLTQAAKLSIKL